MSLPKNVYVYRTIDGEDSWLSCNEDLQEVDADSAEGCVVGIYKLVSLGDVNFIPGRNELIITKGKK